MKSLLTSLIISTVAVSAAVANTAPTPVIVSAAMRPGTTLMDVVFRVNDPDDVTVKVRALAFVDGLRSFSNVLRPVTFVEGTTAKIGDAIASNTNHTLSWDVAADWNMDLGQLKFEILARDDRGLLAFDWVTIPAAGGDPALTISKDASPDASVLSALFWQYADGDEWLTLTNGVLTGNADSGIFNGVTLASGSTIHTYSASYIYKHMNLDPANTSEMGYAVTTARAGLSSISKGRAVNRPYTGIAMLDSWKYYDAVQTTIPTGLNGAISIAAGGMHTLVLKGDGTVVGWGDNTSGQTTIPADLKGVTAIAAGLSNSFAVKSDGTVVGWGSNESGKTAVPPGLTTVTAVAAGGDHTLALKVDGTVVGWGNNFFGQTTIPEGLTGVTAIAAGFSHSLAMKSDGTLVCWGRNHYGQSTIPAGLTAVSAIVAEEDYSLAVKSDGSVVGWGYNEYGLTSIPAGLTGITAIASGNSVGLALKTDGTLAVWGMVWNGQARVPATIPSGLTGVAAITAGTYHFLTLRNKAQ